MSDQIKIYGAPQSQNVRKTLAVAYELDIDFELIPCRPQGDTIKTVNPAGRIPAMVHGDFKLVESNAIMIYLASQKPNALYPDDPKLRGQIHQWMFWDAAHWTPSYQPLQFERVFKRFFRPGPPDEVRVDAALAAFAREAPILNAALQGRDWLVGEGASLADFSIGAGLTYAGPAQMPIEDHANIRAWLERLSALDGWKKSEPSAA